MDRVTQRLWRGVEGPRRCLFLPMLLGAFRPPKPDNRICCDTHLMVTGTSFHAPAIVPTGWQNANRLAARHFMTFTDPVDDPRLPNRKFKRIIIQR